MNTTSGTSTSSWLDTINSLVNTGATAYRTVSGGGTVATQTPTASATLAASGLSTTQKFMLGAAVVLTFVLIGLFAFRKD